MKKLSIYIWEHKFSFLFAILSMIISVSLDMLSPQLTRRIVDDVITDGNLEKLSPMLIGILCVGIGRCIFQYTKEYTFDITGTKIATNLRRDLFHHVQSLSTEFFDRTGTGELMSRMKDDVDHIQDALTFVGMLLLEVIYHTSIILFCMYHISWKLAVLPTICMIIAASIAIYMEQRLDVVYEAISEENARLNTVAEENLMGVRTVKAFAREQFEISKFLSHNKRYYELNMEQSKLFVKYHPYLSLMEMLGWLTNSFSSAIASNRRIKKLYEEKPAVTEPECPVILPDVKGKITFSHVSFHKADQYEILHDISFTAFPGKTIGIMGTTGAGKSSLIYLLQRLYDATEGEILLDDVNIKQLSLQQLRSSISLVMQDVFLFSDTILENVKLGQKNLLSHAAVRDAADRAQAKGFIEKMDKQYDTVIGERGVGLSGGQKQRLTIARALAKKTPVLVLDDSTSALDMETEQLVHETLRNLPDTTKIIIGHRISAVCHADEILILENGQIAERGNHKSLMEKGGLYYQTYVAQYGTPKEELTTWA